MSKGDSIDADPNLEPVIIVTRGEDMVKRPGEKKLHPTFEIRLSLKGSDKEAHLISKFFSEYRALSEGLKKIGVHENGKFVIDETFPPTHAISFAGLSLSEADLQQRCYSLSKWMRSLLKIYPSLLPDAQDLLAAFLDDGKSKTHVFMLECAKRRAQFLAVKPENGVSRIARTATADTVSTAGTDQRSSLRLSTKHHAPLDCYPLGSFLTATIGQGQYVSKRENSDKRHVGYETTLRVVPWCDVKLRKKSDYDDVFYQRYLDPLAPYTVCYSFDTYRNLKNDLDCALSSNSVLIGAPFPRTHRKSSMGLCLNDTELAERMLMLSKWMGSLLQIYHKLSKGSQLLVLQFFAFDAEIKTHNIFRNMLTGEFQLGKKGDTPEDAEAPLPTPLLTQKTENSMLGKQSPSPELAWAEKDGRGEHATHTMVEIDAMETIIHRCIAVRVVSASSVSSNSGSNFETVLRFVPFEDLRLSDAEDCNEYEYTALTETPPPVVAVSYESYLQLKTALEAMAGFRMQRNVEFPGKDFIGRKEGTGTEQRTATLLSRWMGALLSDYASYPPQAQALINAFLKLKDLSSTNPTIISMLLGTFEIPKFKVWQPAGSPTVADGGDVAAAAAATRAVETSFVTTEEPEDVVQTPVETEIMSEHEANPQAPDVAKTVTNDELPVANEVPAAATAAAATAVGDVDSKEVGEEAPAEIDAAVCSDNTDAYLVAPGAGSDEQPHITQQQEHAASSRAVTAGTTQLNDLFEVESPSVEVPVVNDPSVEIARGVEAAEEVHAQQHKKESNAEEGTSHEAPAVSPPPPPPTAEGAVIAAQDMDASGAAPLGNDEASDNLEPAASSCPMPVRDSMFVMAPHPLMVGRPAEGGRPMGGRPIDNTTQESKEDCIIS